MPGYLWDQECPHLWRPEVLDPPGAGVISGYELPGVGVKNQICILCKRRRRLKIV